MIAVLIISGCSAVDDIPPPAPSFSPKPGNYSEPLSVTILVSEPGCRIYFSTDGGDPFTDGDLYSTSISVRSDTTVKAVSVDETGNRSRISKGVYSFRTDPAPTAPVSATLNIPDRQITGVTIDTEYSLDDGVSWYDCGGSVVDVSLSTGDRVWVRKKSDGSETWFLGEVLTTAGPDLVGGNFLYMGTGYWSDDYIAAPGDTHTILYAPSNIGTETIGKDTITVAFYLSEDKLITEEDTLLASQLYPYAVGLSPPTIGSTVEFTVPELPGEYYVGMILDTEDSSYELNEDNNTTNRENVAFFVVEDNSALAEGAIKIVNSWGVGGNWENRHDGHYWLTYDTVKSLNMAIIYYHNDFSTAYDPRALAVFSISHDRREECLVTFGLGTPEAPYLSKEFQIRWSSNIQSGAEPFPANNMALDISEFSHAINDFDLFLHIENSGSLEGSVGGFSVELYDDYEASPFRVFSHPGGAEIPANGSVTVTIETADSLSSDELYQILSLPKPMFSETVFHEEKPGPLQLERDKRIIGVYETDKNYNVLYQDKYGTGYTPPSEESWDRMVRLMAVETSTPAGELPFEVDHSLTEYFPPIGSQGTEGSCTAFSFAYYIHTYTEAREHGWDLSGATWLGNDPSGGANDGGPSAQHANMIFSPDFVYHAINEGSDSGSNGSMAVVLLTRMGCATWAEMPYDTSDSTSWPSEAAFREAARYRAREVNANPYYDHNTAGYFIIEDDADIQLLKTLLAADYCVQTVVYTDGLYPLLDSNDVVSGYTDGPMSTNHAQTVVGYKEGDAWNVSDPDG